MDDLDSYYFNIISILSTNQIYGCHVTYLYYRHCVDADDIQSNDKNKKNEAKISS